MDVCHEALHFLSIIERFLPRGRRGGGGTKQCLVFEDAGFREACGYALAQNSILSIPEAAR